MNGWVGWLVDRANNLALRLIQKIQIVVVDEEKTISVFILIFDGFSGKDRFCY